MVSLRVNGYEMFGDNKVKIDGKICHIGQLGEGLYEVLLEDNPKAEKIDGKTVIYRREKM